MTDRLPPYPDEWLGFKVLRGGAPLATGAIVELVGAEVTPLCRLLAVRRVADGDYRVYGGAYAGVSAEWLRPRALHPLTPAAAEFLELFADSE